MKCYATHDADQQGQVVSQKKCSSFHLILVHTLVIESLSLCSDPLWASVQVRISCMAACTAFVVQDGTCSGGAHSEKPKPDNGHNAYYVNSHASDSTMHAMSLEMRQVSLQASYCIVGHVA